MLQRQPLAAGRRAAAASSCWSSNSPSSRLKRAPADQVDAIAPDAARGQRQLLVVDAARRLAGQRIRRRRPDPPVREPRRQRAAVAPRQQRRADQRPQRLRLPRPRHRIARRPRWSRPARRSAPTAAARRAPRCPRTPRTAKARVRCTDRVAAVEREEVDQVEVDLPPQLEIDAPADVPPAQERVQDVELALFQLADLVAAGRPPEHVAAEVAVEPQRGVEVQDVAIAVVAAPGARARCRARSGPCTA